MKMIKSIPALPVQDIAAAIVFYRDRLGFSIPHHDEGFAIAVRDGVEVHLWAAGDQNWKSRSPSSWGRPVQSGAESFIAGTASCRIEVQGIDALFAEYKDRGVLYAPSTTVQTQPWGTREFPALDLERNLLTFFENI